MILQHIYYISLQKSGNYLQDFRLDQALSRNHCTQNKDLLALLQLN
jgi:hypothetical protein